VCSKGAVLKSDGFERADFYFQQFKVCGTLTYSKSWVGIAGACLHNFISSLLFPRIQGVRLLIPFPDS
jgi:hypothetical protein